MPGSSDLVLLINSFLCQKLVLEAVVYVPPMTSAIIVLRQYLETFSVSDCREKWRHDFLKIMEKSMFFLLRNFPFNFMYVPARHRVLYAYFFQIFWGVYVSYVINKPLENGGESYVDVKCSDISCCG